MVLPIVGLDIGAISSGNSAVLRFSAAAGIPPPQHRRGMVFDQPTYYKDYAKIINYTLIKNNRSPKVIAPLVKDQTAALKFCKI